MAILRAAHALIRYPQFQTLLRDEVRVQFFEGMLTTITAAELDKLANLKDFCAEVTR